MRNQPSVIRGNGKSQRIEKSVVLRQIGRVRLPSSTVCARCGSAAVEMAIREDGAVKAYCLPCVEQMKEEREHACAISHHYSMISA